MYRVGDRIFRTVMPIAAADFAAVRATGLLDRLVESGRLLRHDPVDAGELGAAAAGAAYVLEHPRLPFVSHPYEWPFAALKAAALLQLDLILEALPAGVALNDASAYNVQFIGADPVFIDTLSFRPYVEGSYWLGHRQFCEQFLNPLLLRSHLGLDYHAWYRGALEGIPAADLARLLPWWRKLSPNVAMHVVLQARLQGGRQAREKAEAALATGGLSKQALTNIVRGLRVWIQDLAPAAAGRTVFQDYATDNTYSSDDTQFKARFVGEFAVAERPAVVLDLGCNTGHFAHAALAAGAGYAVGVDGDTGALDRLFADARQRRRPLLSLHMNLTDPSPAQGWAERERDGFTARSAQTCDAVLALALVHHLAIAGNVPLPQVVQWITALAPTGVIEFVPKADPMVQRLLALREDIFVDYDEAAFVRAIEARADIVASATVPGTGRRLFRFRRRA